MRHEKQDLEAAILREQETVEAFQRRCAELEDQKVQTKILLESSQSDKATISRVMQQNEKLKNEFEELQLQLVTVVSSFFRVTLEDYPGSYHYKTLPNLIGDVNVKKLEIELDSFPFSSSSDIKNRRK